MKILILLTIVSMQPILQGCDPEHKKECEWFLMPDLDRKDDPRIKEGNIPVCARNLVVNKEDCRLQAGVDFAKSAWKKKFRYSSLETTGLATPRQVASIKYCE